jgi:alginate O-acetyltransferase complex protein AlgJ
MTATRWRQLDASGDTRRRPPARVVIAALAIVFMFAPLVAFGVGLRARPFENHKLADAPRLSQGWSALSQLNQWATDHLPGRQQAIRINNRINRGLGDQPASPGVNAGATDALGPAITPAQSPEDSVPYPQVIEGTDGYLFFGGDAANPCTSKLSAPEILSNVRALAAAVESSGRKFVLVVAPNKSTMMPDKLPDDFLGKDCAAARSDVMWSQLSTEPFFIDLRQPLFALAPTLPDPLYLRADSHWDGPAGALATTELVERIDPAITDSFDPRQILVKSQPGDLSQLLGTTDQDTVHVTEIAAPTVTHRRADLNVNLAEPTQYISDGPPGTLVTQPTLLLCDSFALASAPSLTSIFADITLVDHLNAATDLADVVDRIVTSDVVVLEVVERDLFSGLSPMATASVVAEITAALQLHPLS